MTPPLHPDFAPVLQAMAGHRIPAGDVETRRANMDAATASMNAAAKAASTSLDTAILLQTHSAPSEDAHHDILIWHYTLKDPITTISKRLPAVLNMHPGGLITGSATIMDAGIRRHVLETGIPFFDIEYRLAPEHPYPTPQEDCWAALLWIRSHAAELDIDENRIILMGESAGGCLASGLAFRASQEQVPLAGLILVSPMLDDRTGRSPIGDNSGDQDAAYTWTSDDNVTAWNAVLGNGARDTLPGGSVPAVPGRLEDVSGLPRTFLQIAGNDLFLEEDLAFGALLARQGVHIETVTYLGVPHGFEVIQPECEVSRRARHDRNLAIRALAGSHE